MSKDFLGSGWSFPVRIGANGKVALARQERDIEEAIVMILLTGKGQRVLRPEFGCRIHELIFAPNDMTTAGLAVYYVEEALLMWEPRIRVESVDVNPNEQQPERLDILVEYTIKATNDRRSLVYPFYRIPGE